MNLTRYMTGGISRIMKAAGRFYLGSREGQVFLATTLPRLHAAAKRREAQEAAGLHVPPFLIASIASRCNLHCAGCYARAGGACGGADLPGDLTAQEWADIFGQASALGVSFVLLAGGEPLTRRDVLQAAAACGNLVFPVFTNGTLIGAQDVDLFHRARNLIPVLSLEGDRVETDQRRGDGVYQRLDEVMASLRERRILFGASITVSKANLEAVLHPSFLDGLHRKGCGAAIFVEYVPVQQETQALALEEADAQRLAAFCQAARGRLPDMAVLSFPGDEANMGGCLAAGRGFFHINAQGGAEPCPFSPFSVQNLRTSSVRQALESGFFQDLRAIAAKPGGELGGCTLFARENEVRALLGQASPAPCPE